jgi:hypothetical protein
MNDEGSGCPTNFSLSCVGFRASHLSSALAVTHDKLKFVGHSPSLHLFLVHTSSGNSTKREAVEPLAALTGMEVCDLMFATSVPSVFGDILQIQR